MSVSCLDIQIPENKCLQSEGKKRGPLFLPVSTQRNTPSECCPNRCSLCPVLTMVLCFYWSSKIQLFFRNIGAPTNVQAVSIPHMTFQTGPQRESTAGSGGGCQSCGDLAEHCKHNTASAQLRRLLQPLPAAAPFLQIQKMSGPMTHPETRRRDLTRKETRFCNISRQSKIGTVCSRPIVTKW